MFSSSRKVLTETEIRFFEKGLGFGPTPTRINESDLKRDFNEFPRKMRCKWYFRSESTENVSEKPVFSILPGSPRDYKLSKEEWLAMRGLAEDRNIIIKLADKGSCGVLWDRED